MDTGETLAGRFYASQDCALFVESCIFVVVYEESNGLPGLQRQDYLSDNVKACQDQGFDVQPDTLLFENPDRPF